MQRFWLVVLLLPSSVLRGAEAPQVAPHAKLVVTLVDDATGKPLPRGWVEMFPPGERSGRTQVRPEGRSQEDPPGQFEFSVPAGEYAIVPRQRAGSLGGLQYELPDGEQQLTLAAGERRELTLRLHGRPLTPEEVDRRAPFTAVGRVVDESGEPIEDAVVRAATGIGTLLGGGATRTDRNGEYVLRFGTGVMLMDSASQFQMAQFWVESPGRVEAERSHDYRYLDFQLPPELPYDAQADQVITRDAPGRIDFVMARPAEVSVVLQDEQGEPVAGDWGLALSPSGSRGASLLRDDQGKYVAGWRLLPGREWQLRRGEARSAPLRFERPGSCEVTLRARSVDGVELLEVAGVTEGGGPARGVTIGDDPFARPPLPERQQEHARELVRRMGQAGRDWLEGHQSEARRYTYRFEFLGDQPEAKEMRVAAGERRHGSHQGVSYWSAVHALAARPDAAVFLSIDKSPGKVTLSYRLKVPIRQAMGTGVGGSWRGYFSRQLRQGTLVLNAEGFTPIEHRDDEVHERYECFTATGDGRLAPLRVVIDKEQHAWCDWRFAWRSPGLWMLHEAVDPSGGEVLARVTDVRVDGKPSEALAVGSGSR